jgi:hypothetical protein
VIIPEDIMSGRWIDDRDVAPETNCYNRPWKTRDDTLSGTCFGYRTIPNQARELGLLWYFPNAPKS